MHDIHIPTPAPLPPVIFTSILTTVLMLHMLLHHLLTIPGTLYTRYIVATFMIIGTIATFGGAQLEESQHVLNQLFGLILATVLLSTPLLLQNGHYEIETDSRAPSLPKGFRLFADLERDKLPFVPNDQEPSAVPQETSATEDEKNEKIKRGPVNRQEITRSILSGQAHFVNGIQHLAILLVLAKLASYVPELRERVNTELDTVPSIHKQLSLPIPIPPEITAPILTIVTGAGVFMTLEVAYSLSAAFAINVLGCPADYFKEFSKTPWKATSLSDFWGKRWHRLFNNIFRYYASCVPERFAVLRAMVVFLMSGILHDLGSVTHSGVLSPSEITLFFFLQAPLICLERSFRAASGHRVDGFWGYMWTWAWLAFTGQLLVEAWFRRGVLGDILSNF